MLYLLHTNQLKNNRNFWFSTASGDGGFGMQGFRAVAGTRGVRDVATTRHLGLGVVESRWFERHHTVRPLFEFLSYALKDRSDAFTYERFVGAPSFRDAVRYMTSGGDVDFLYVASHGDFGKIETPHGDGLSRTFIRNTLVEANRKRRKLKGVLFGSCKFGDEDTLIEVLRPARIGGEEVDNRLIWAAGYGREIDYTQSSLVDIAFFDHFFRTTSGDEIHRLKKTVVDLEKAMPGLVKTLQLRIVARVRRGTYLDIITDETLTDTGETTWRASKGSARKRSRSSRR